MAIPGRENLENMMNEFQELCGSYTKVLQDPVWAPHRTEQMIHLTARGMVDLDTLIFEVRRMLVRYDEEHPTELPQLPRRQPLQPLPAPHTPAPAGA